MKHFIISFILTVFFLIPYFLIDIQCSSYDISYLSLSGLFFIYVLLKKRFNNRRKNIIIVILSISFTIGISDIILRCFFYNHFYFNPTRIFKTTDPDIKDCFRYNKNIHYFGNGYGDLAAILGLKKLRQIRKINFITDKYGFRNKSADDIYDIIVIGDSFGAGEGVSQEKAWYSILEKEHNLKIYNLSVDANSLWQEFIILRANFKRIKLKKNAKILWMIFPANDLDDRYYDYYDPKYLTNIEKVFSIISLFRRKSIIALLFRRITNIYFYRNIPNPVIKKKINDETVLFWNEYIERSKRTNENIFSHYNFNYFKKVFSKMKKFIKKNNIEINIVVIPSKEEIYYNKESSNDIYNIIKDICKKNGFKYFNLKPYFIKQFKNSNILFWKDDTHWNEKGHKYISEKIYKNLSLY